MDMIIGTFTFQEDQLYVFSGLWTEIVLELIQVLYGIKHTIKIKIIIELTQNMHKNILHTTIQYYSIWLSAEISLQ